ncbi:restriction endonuclease subunit S [Klebsiella pneumoniae]|nr:restriction endonuclease subunit S [Klebsiella pneumoniae]HCM2979392.1 restriction endonuclease subunit S [Klebsiella pneumoniae]
MSSDLMPPKGWIVSDAQSYCTKIADGTHDSPKQSAIGNLLVTSKNIIDGELDLSKSYFISEEDYSKINRRSKVDKNDVLLSMIGTVGQACVVEQEPNFAIKNVGLLKNDDPIKAKWLYFYLSSPKAQQLIKERLKGTTQQYLSLGEIRKLPVFYPESHDVMKRVVYFLDSLRKKIIINNSVSRTLEQMAQALFKSWFVDFDPVKAKMAVLDAGGSQADATLAAMSAISGKDTDALEVFKREHPEQYAELKATAELFPSAMQDSELGDIPEGWYLQRFSNIATLHYGKALKKTERIEGPYSVYGSGGITGSHNSYLVEGPGIIVGRKGSIGTLYWEDGKFHPIDTVYYVENKEGVPLTYLYYLMGTLNLSSMNTDAAVPGLNRDNVYRLETINPEIAILNEFNNHVSALRNMIQRNKSSTETLTQLRDTLLPKLLSGEITLPEAEQAVSEAENV